MFFQLGYEFRLEQLNNARRRAVILQEAADKGQDYDPFCEYEKRVMEEHSGNKVWKYVKNLFGRGDYHLFICLRNNYWNRTVRGYNLQLLFGPTLHITIDLDFDLQNIIDLCLLM